MSRFVSSLARTLDFGESTSHKPIRGLTSLRTSQGPQVLGRRRLGLLRGPISTRCSTGAAARPRSRRVTQWI